MTLHRPGGTSYSKATLPEIGRRLISASENAYLAIAPLNDSGAA